MTAANELGCERKVEGHAMAQQREEWEGDLPNWREGETEALGAGAMHEMK